MADANNKAGKPPEDDKTKATAADKAAERLAAEADGPEETTTITVAKGFTLTLVHGQPVEYRAGIHRNVPVSHADHWYTKAHLATEDDAEA